MRSGDEIKAVIEKWFDNPGRLDKWLRAEARCNPLIGLEPEQEAQGGAWHEVRKDLEFNLKAPTEREAREDFKGFSAFVKAWKEWDGAPALGLVSWKKRNWAGLGQQMVPIKVNFLNLEAMSSWIGRAESWRNLSGRYRRLLIKWPGLVEVLKAHLRALRDYDNQEWDRVTKVLEWLEKNPQSGLYLRQLPLGGLDSKWLEKHKALVGDLAGVILGRTGDFFERCGLVEAPSLARIRVLDPELRAKLGGLGHFMAPAGSLAQLDIRPEVVFVVENLQTGLAFGDLPGAVLIFGHGYALDFLSEIPWIGAAKKLYYWGDIDRHGFGILSKARDKLPGLVSIFMDQETLMANKNLWGLDDPQAMSGPLNLSPSEAELFKALLEDKFGPRVRFEQERLAWHQAWPVIQGLV
ncbi:MAG: DUF2220 family protein [Deltaproteobacteria bacterium]|jgi:hypothetical protein|nr:DUF2220 family protein [Deltaproteobacteria bacterium]